MRGRWSSAIHGAATVTAFLIFAVGAWAADNPMLSVRSGPAGATKESPLKIGKLDIDVTLVGDTAHTTVTANFLNAGGGALEGNFVFDLPPGSVVTGYALDIGGKMVDGVLVGQRKAQVTYDARVRRGYDPGLATVTRAGAFTTRVFPILAGAGRTVRLEFVTPLDPGRPFVVPLSTEQPVGAVSIHVKTDAKEPPTLQGPDGVALQWKGGEASAGAEKRALAGALGIGPVTMPQPLLLARHADDETFFEINDIAVPGKLATAQPERVRLYWDSSRSRRDADLKQEIDLVGRYVTAVHPANLDIVFFSTDEPIIRSFSAPSASAVTAVLASTYYQGGTSLKPLTRGGLPEADLCLLFSDGNITVDPRTPVRAPCRLMTVSSAKDANRALLKVLARKSSGDFVDLGITAPEAALQALMRQTPRITEVRSSTGEDVDYAVLPASGNRFRLIGRLPDSGDIVVGIGRAADKQRRYKVNRDAIIESDALGALWASQAIDAMAASEQPDREALVAFSRRYSIASTEASFVVFENLSDYVEADVQPPAVLGKDVLAQFRALKAAREAEKAKAVRERLDTVARLWADEKKWWNTVFKPVPHKPVQPVERDNREALQRAPAPPPPAPMMAAAPPREAAGNDTQTVVVTGYRGTNAAPPEPSIEVTMAPWNPDRPYIKALSDAKPEAYWNAYLDQEKAFGSTPAFYLDVAEFLFRHGKPHEAVRVALNALELPSADTTTMTILADRLMRYGDVERAIWLYERIRWLEPDRPQPTRNLALALGERALKSGDGAESPAEQQRDLKRALGLLNEVVTRDWPAIYNGIEVVSLMEANRILAKLKKQGVDQSVLDKRLVALLDVDLRVVLEWNTDGTDMDLWVDEPSGERAIYSNPKTAIGGRLSNDMRNGYGPEEYLLHRAPDGTYTIRVNVYATDRLNPNGATNIRAHVFRNYGRDNEQEQLLELELKRSDDSRDHLIGTVKVNRGK